MNTRVSNRPARLCRTADAVEQDVEPIPTTSHLRMVMGTGEALQQYRVLWEPVTFDLVGGNQVTLCKGSTIETDVDLITALCEQNDDWNPKVELVG